jgi:hypothetical protein
VTRQGDVSTAAAGGLYGGRTLIIEAVDWDRFGKHDVLGQVSIVLISGSSTAR